MAVDYLKEEEHILKIQKVVNDLDREAEPKPLTIRRKWKLGKMDIKRLLKKKK